MEFEDGDIPIRFCYDCPCGRFRIYPFIPPGCSILITIDNLIEQMRESLQVWERHGEESNEE